jgi:hypothetical protein
MKWSPWAKVNALPVPTLFGGAGVQDLTPSPSPNGEGSLLPPRSGRAGEGFVPQGHYGSSSQHHAPFKPKEAKIL